MKVTILEGSKSSDGIIGGIREALDKKLIENKWEVKTFVLRDIKIAPCLGCFDCWLKTPGRCVINDSETEITQEAFQSDLLIFLTPVIFGSCSSEIKKVLDRWISIVLPFFEKVDKHVRHIQRYAKHPALFFVGEVKQKNAEEESTFCELAKRIALNSRAPVFASEIVFADERIDEVSKKVFCKLADLQKSL